MTFWKIAGKGMGFFVIIVLILVLSTNIYAASITQKFRGLKWGDSPTRDMVFLEQEGYIRGYTKFNENLHMGEVPLSSVVYMFYNNQFMEVRLYFSGRENYDTLVRICTEKFCSLILHYHKPEWLWLYTTLAILYDDTEGYIRIFDKPVMERWQRDLARKRKKEARIAVEKTEGDW